MYGSLKADALNRITREVRKAVPEWRKYIKESGGHEDDLFHHVRDDVEVKTEIENLVRIIIEEMEFESNQIDEMGEYYESD